MNFIKATFFKNLIVLGSIILHVLIGFPEIIIPYCVLAMGVEVFFFWKFYKQENAKVLGIKINSFKNLTQVKSPHPVDHLLANVTIVNGEEKVDCVMLVDTGCNRGLTLPSDLIKRLKLVSKGETMVSTSVMGIKETRSYIGKASIGNMEATHVLITESMHSGHDGSYEGLIGLDLISHYGLSIKKVGNEFIYSFGENYNN